MELGGGTETGGGVAVGGGDETGGGEGCGFGRGPGDGGVDGSDAPALGAAAKDAAGLAVTDGLMRTIRPVAAAGLAAERGWRAAVVDAAGENVDGSERSDVPGSAAAVGALPVGLTASA